MLGIFFFFFSGKSKLEKKLFVCRFLAANGIFSSASENCKNKEEEKIV